MNNRKSNNKGVKTMRNILAILAGPLFLAWTASAIAAETDWKKVDAVLAKTPVQSGAIYRYGFPRTDLKVTLDGVEIKPGLALGGWMAFQPMPDGAMAMGDLVLTEAEVNPVMASMLASGMDVTAVHNHLLRATPATFYMHFAGHGDPVTLAQAVRDSLALTKTPFDPPAPAPAAIADLGIDTGQMEQVLGFKGRNNGGVYQFGIPRSDTVLQDGMAVPGAMGSAIVINFQPTGAGKAAITGDFTVLAKEVNPLLKALRNNGIEVTALHNHMLDDEPRTFYIHFWANDDAVKLARGLRLGLDAVHVAAQQ